MVIVSILLITEYQYFKKQSQKLITLKEDYQNYVSAFRRALYDYSKIKERLGEFEGAEEEKKKVNNDEDPQNSQNEDQETNENGKEFIVVNREPAYLRESAIRFSKKHNLERAVHEMYEMCGWDVDYVPLILPAGQTKKKQRIRRSMRFAQSNMKMQREMQIYAADFSIAWPMDRSNFWLGSKFGPRKKNDGSWGFHYGLDLPAPKGTPVKAAATGLAVEVSYSDKGYGKSVVIAHSKKYRTRYAHLHKIFVKVGQKIDAGQLIGLVGATGAVRGRNPSHLHLEVLAFGKRVNPLYFLPRYEIRGT